MGGVHVLEAVIVASIMMSAIAFVSTHQDAGSSLDPIDQLLTDRGHNFLGVMNELPWTMGSCGNHSTSLERLMVEGLAGKHDYWKNETNLNFGPGVDASLYLDNHRGLLPLHESYKGAASTASIPYVLEGAYVTPLATSEMSGATNATLAFAALKDGELQRTKGEGVRITVTSQVGVTTQHTIAWRPTALGWNAARVGVGNLSFTALNGNSQLVRGLVQDDLGNSITIPIHARSNHTGEAVKVGTSLVVQFPPAWTYERTENAAWLQSSAIGDASTGTTVRLTRQSVSSPDDAITLRAIAPSDATRPFDIITAQLGNGSFGQSSLVVTYPSPVDHDLPRLAYPTVPYPLEPGHQNFFGVAFANGGEATKVTQVDVEVPGGYDLDKHKGLGADLFRASDQELIMLQPTSGWRAVDTKHVRWVGSIDVPAASAAWWGVGINVTGNASEITSIEPDAGDGVSTTLRFSNGFNDTSRIMGSAPGILTHRVPPASTNGWGYPGAAGDVGRVYAYNVTANAFHSTPHVVGNYSISPAADAIKTQSAMEESSFSVKHRLVPLGGVVEADVDMQSLATQFAGSGVGSVTVDVKMFTPIGIGCSPVRTWSSTTSTLPGSRATALELYDPAGVGVGSAFLAATDMRLHRVETTGTAAWSSVLPSAALVAARGTTSGVPSLYVGDASGLVSRVDPVTGIVSWMEALRRVPDGVHGTVTALDVSPDGARLVASDSLGDVTVFDLPTHAVVAERHDAGVGYKAARFGSPSEIFTLTDAGVVERRDVSLTPLDQGLVQAGATVLGLTPTRVLVAGGGSRIVLDRANLASGSPDVLGDASGLFAAGDATGDGIEDLAGTGSDLTLTVMDGATLQTASWATPFRETGTQAKKTFGLLHDEVCSMPVDPGPTYGVDDAALRDAPYGETPECKYSTQKTANALRIENGRLVYAFTQAGQGELCAFHDLAQLSWCHLMPYDRVPVVLAVGTFGTQSAVGVGGADGALGVYALADGSDVQSANPTKFSGLFSFHAGIPLGAFYGTHVLTATASWLDAAGATRSATLADWFDVVDVDGTPIPQPAYSVGLVLKDRGVK